MATTLTALNQEFVPKAWETVSCPFCGENESKLFERFGYLHRYRYVQCTACQLAYQSPRPKFDADFTETAYEVYSVTDPFRDSNGLTARGKIVYREYAYILSEIESQLGRKGTILEIGCNTGFFCGVAKSEGWKPLGIEISKTMTEVAKSVHGVEAMAGDWTQLQYETKFDAIYCSHVIEHIPDPSAWMKKFKEVMTPDGIVCLSVPNMQSIDRKFKRMLKKIGLKKDRWQKWRTPDHLYEPCDQSMSVFIENQGFEVLKKYSYPSEWDGKVGLWHWLFHFKLKWGAKFRFLIRPGA